LCDAVLARIVDQRLGTVFPVNGLGINTEIFREAKMTLDRGAVLRRRGLGFLLGVNVHRHAHRMEVIGHAPGAPQQHGGRGIGSNVD